MDKKKIALQTSMAVISVLLNIWGLLSLLHTIQVFNVPFLAYLDNLRLLLKYVVIVITMACGIMLFARFATTFKGKVKNTLAIINCTYSTILTLPLFGTFVGCFWAMKGINVPMVSDICNEFMDIFKSTGLQYFIFIAGTIMGIAFLAVPIWMTVQTVKKD